MLSYIKCGEIPWCCYYLDGLEEKTHSQPAYCVEGCWLLAPGFFLVIKCYKGGLKWIEGPRFKAMIHKKQLLDVFFVIHQTALFVLEWTPGWLGRKDFFEAVHIITSKSFLNFHSDIYLGTSFFPIVNFWNHIFFMPSLAPPNKYPPAPLGTLPSFGQPGHHYIGSVAFDRTLKFWSTQVGCSEQWPSWAMTVVVVTPTLPPWRFEGLGGGNSNIFFSVHPENWGRWSNLTNMFQMGWNHQLEVHVTWFKGTKSAV